MEIDTEIRNPKTKSPRGFGKIGVLMGGPSSEREISLKSGNAVYESLKQSGVDAVSIDIKVDNLEENADLIRSFNIDCAFIALHGYFGEDGLIQGILELLKIPYTGSGVQASRMAINKASSHEKFESGGLNIPKYKSVSKPSGEDDLAACLRIGLPLVVKPARNGSSIGLSVIDKEGALPAALEKAFKFDEIAIVEEYIKGRELTVGILDTLALPVIEIVPKGGIFDYEAKYHAGLTEYIIPARLDKLTADKVSLAALTAHKLLGCVGYSRVDIILDKNSVPVILEINTIPGFTNMSLLPKAARCAGIEFNELCLKLISLAYESRTSSSSGSRRSE